MNFFPPDGDIWWYLECITNPLLWSLVITEEVHNDKHVNTMTCNDKDVLRTLPCKHPVNVLCTEQVQEEAPRGISLISEMFALIEVKT